MPTMDTDAVAYQLKRVYGGVVTDLFARHVMTYNLFLKSNRPSSVTPAGVGYYFALRQADNEAIRGQAQGVILPLSQVGDGVQGVITPKLIYGALRLSGLMIEAGKTDVAAFVNTQGDAVANLYNAMVNDLNRQCWGDGYGLLATTSATSDTLSTSTTWTVTCDNDWGVRYLKPGMVVDFYESGAIDESSVGSQISSIDPTTRIVTMAANASAYKAYHPIGSGYTVAAGTIASGAHMVRYGARIATHTTSAASYEIMGMLGMYDDSTRIAVFEGVTIANDPQFKANILSNNGVNRNVSEDLMLAAMDMTLARSGMRVSTIRMGLGQRRKYFGELVGDRRYVTGKMVGGYEQVGFSQNGAIQMVIDPHTPPNRMFFEPDGVIKKYELTQLGWGGFDPNKMHWREGYDEATMFLRTYTNLGVEQRNALTLLNDLTEPTGGAYGTMPF